MNAQRIPALARLSALCALFALLVLAPWVRTGTATAQSTPIKHIVVLYLENHTFDSLLGYWCDQHPSRGCAGMPSSVRLSNGKVITPRVSPDIVSPVQHTVWAQNTAIDHGKMDGWWRIPGCNVRKNYACVAGYEPGQVPNLVRLAAKFAISDHTFSMSNSPSFGGHLYAAMGSLDGFTGDIPVVDPGVARGPGWGCNSNRITQWRRAPQDSLRWV